MYRLHLLSIFSPETEHRLCALAARQGFRPHASQPGLWLTEDEPDREALLAALLPVVRREGIVAALDRPGEWPRAVVFDLDSTLIRCEFIDELAAERGIAGQVRRLTAEAMDGKADFRTSYARRLKLLEGTPLAVVREVIGRLPLAPGARALMDELKRRRIPSAIITGGYRRAGEAVRSRLGIDALYATELEERGGMLTGGFASELLDEQGKRAALEDFARRCGLPLQETAVVGDGANDLKMLARAGTSVLYDACPPAPARPQPLDTLLPLFGNPAKR